MLYILPPPSTAKPPSVWDLILNFHRKGCPDSDTSTFVPLKKAKLPLKFNTRERKVHQSWCNTKTTSSSCQTASSHDSGGSGGRDDDNQRSIKSLNECYFAGKGTALMLGSNERLQLQLGGDNRRFSQLSNELSASQTSIGSTGSDIQQHLQSMFYLLRPEETLKMAVKLESLRPGRTRYLVVVSRPKQQYQQQNLTLSATTPSHTPKITSHSRSDSISMNQTSYFHETSSSTLTTMTTTTTQMSSGGSPRFSANTTATSTCDNSALDDDKNSKFQCHFAGNTTTTMSMTTTKTTTTSNDATSVLSDNESVSSSRSNMSASEGEESCLLGIDCNEKTTVGLVLRVLADTAIRLDGDGGFSVSVCGRQHIFKPVSVQAMWSALQTLYKKSSKAQEQNFFAGGPSHDWVQYYENRIESDRSCLNEWHAMDSLESRRPPSPDTIRNKPIERDETERVIRTALKEIMMSVDLDEVTSKYIRGRLEEHLDMDLGEFKSFIDEEMLVILGQMDAPTEIFDHVYLGSEWNASNLEELQRNGVRHILNVTREIDNFFPGIFDYYNVRVYDDEKTDLLKHWDNTFRYISRAKMEGSKVLVHCKMGISRSASVVVAYAMKAYNWDFGQAIQHVKEKRNCIKPNKAFVSQLETYQGILDAMKNREKLQRSKSETNLKSENAKEGKMLPGSEPTPLIQALQHSKNSTYPSSKKEASYMKRISQRPNSSPDISKSASETVSLIKPISMSLETLATDQTTTAATTTNSQNPVSETTNLRWPCDHGQYSVSQNQIIHLQNQTEQKDEVMNIEPSPIVRSIISELEQHQERMKLKDAQLKDAQSWDPDDDNKQQIYSSHAEIIRQDSFKKSSGNTDEEKMKTENSPTPAQAFVSRQSSWSSVDSACIIGDLLPSRNSSWGSGDNNQRIVPSRNSSWGSYDTKGNQLSLLNDDPVNISSSGIFAYEKDEIPWHPGTVKRTKQKIEEKHVPQSSNSSLLRSSSANDANKKTKSCDIKKHGGKMSTSSCSVKQPQRKCVKLASTDLPSSNDQVRSKSEEYLIENDSGQLQLSASAPETSCIMNKLQERRQKSCESSQSIGSKVKNLKMNFEAKANQNQKTSSTSSLPSSPIAIHIDMPTVDIFPNEDIKSLIDRYEVPKSPNGRQRPKSMYESKYSSKSSSIQPKFISHQTKLPKTDGEFKRPPIPAQQPIVKNALMSVNTNQQNVKPALGNCRKIQQHGKTHPLAKLGINKPRINPATAYNTM